MIRTAISGISLFLLLTGFACAVPPDTIADLGTPFVFTYGSWEKRAAITGGKILLRGEGLDARGGGGANVDLDLVSQRDRSPALRVMVGPKNKLKTIRLMLRDASGQAATYNFDLPSGGSGISTIAPVDGASLDYPNALEKPGATFDLTKIKQWQVIGDWSNADVVDVEISGIVLIPPDAPMLAARAARAKQDAAERDRIRQDQEAQIARYKAEVPSAPRITHVAQVGPDLLSLTIQAGKVQPSTFVPYSEQPGDEKRENNGQVILKRNGQEIGWLIGGFFKPQGKRDHLVTFETCVGDPLLTFVADRPQTYTINGSRPLAVYRKSKPTDWAQPSKVFAMQHTLYLKLPAPLQIGQTYTIETTGLNIQNTKVSFVCNPDNVRSEAVHVNQIGYRPDDRPKRAFLSLWMGNGDAYTYPNGLAFRLIEERTGKAVFRGKVMPLLAANATEEMKRMENFSKTAIYSMDFSTFQTPGIYHISVDAVGSSYSFPIGRDTWEKAFRVQMRGLSNERSGVKLAPPYADYTRPRDFHPADGVPVYESTYSILDGPGESPELAKRSTGKLVPDAWGGYHDAGDWNPRRVSHLKVTMAQMEMLALFPDYFSKLALSIPHKPNVPDVLTEALFEIDCFRRLQKPDGGVSFGIETAGDPIEGELSFMQSMPAYVYAPDLWSSYRYAQAGARASKLLNASAPDLATVYRESAIKAMLWAEKEWARRVADGSLAKLSWEVKDDRNFAAILLYDLTGNRRWHDVFLENTVLTTQNPNLFAYGTAVQRDAAFAYTVLPAKLADQKLRERAIQGITRQAEQALSYANGNALNLTTPDRGRPLILGFFSTPDAIELCRAHYLTQKPEYLAGAIQATQFASGCNPNNMTYTTGLGKNPPLHPLFLDTRHMGVPSPVGLTVYGNWDKKDIPDFSEWVYSYFLNAQCTPSASDWPVTEAYFDIFLFPSSNEFTVDIWDKNIYVWGYLAARK